MFKVLCISIGIFLLIHPCFAQGIFNQKKTQTRYKIEQIAKLRLYLEYLKTGYSTVHTGLSLIGDIKKGDFDLHSLFFQDLYTVKPVFRKYSKCNHITNNIKLIQSEIQDIISFLNSENLFVQPDIISIENSVADFYSQLINDLFQLGEILSNGFVQMKDAERFERIDKLLVSVEDKRSWVTKFGQKIRLLSMHRRMSSSDIKQLDNLSVQYK
ncbi:hypothetical protein [Chitinophaga niabensis]|uniref:TerB family tellurite resistance protein n=1 Tax=Chitinophaga niabensis TaxID=536979 RepID=A0A1N6KB90_9BACT|nr:hypothetical protein [Chitinophaga niabensis]SIO53820.1 hypothetical protein SAMN04488055_5486 [Chitinophaga niabensis]